MASHSIRIPDAHLLSHHHLDPGKRLLQRYGSANKWIEWTIWTSSGLHPDLNWRKWNCHLDLQKYDDKANLRALILEADVIINGYSQPCWIITGSATMTLSRCAGPVRGIIYVRENCFGWGGRLAADLFCAVIMLCDFLAPVDSCSTPHQKSARRSSSTLSQPRHVYHVEILKFCFFSNR